MQVSVAGDFDYDRHGQGYARHRRTDPRIAALVHQALGEARSVVNVGAGAGSYEPVDRAVVAVEPSAAMRAQRPAHLAPTVGGVAEHLPFADGSFDAAMAMVTIHQWPDVAAGLLEMRRVARGPIVVLTFDAEALARFWLADYGPELIETECRRFPPVDQIGSILGGRSTVTTVPIPHDCVDGFGEAFYGRPEAFLDADVRRAQSMWGFIDAATEAATVDRLRSALTDGSWDAHHGRLRTTPTYEGSLRLITNLPST
jgi:hypothetical protein